MSLATSGPEGPWVERPLAGTPFVLSPFQEFIVGSLFGWFAIKISKKTGAQRVRQRFRLTAEDLDGEAPTFQAGPHSTNRLGGPARERLSREELGEGERGAQLLADRAERKIRHRLHRRQERAGVKLDVADAHAGPGE